MTRTIWTLIHLGYISSLVFLWYTRFNYISRYLPFFFINHLYYYFVIYLLTIFIFFFLVNFLMTSNMQWISIILNKGMSILFYYFICLFIFIFKANGPNPSNTRVEPPETVSWTPKEPPKTITETYVLNQFHFWKTEIGWKRNQYKPYLDHHY